MGTEGGSEQPDAAGNTSLPTAGGRTRLSLAPLPTQTFCASVKGWGGGESTRWGKAHRHGAMTAAPSWPLRFSSLGSLQFSAFLYAGVLFIRKYVLPSLLPRSDCTHSDRLQKSFLADWF